VIVYQDLFFLGFRTLPMQNFDPTAHERAGNHVISLSLSVINCFVLREFYYRF
jgi:hypothetical protein